MHQIQSGVSQGIILGLALYQIRTSTTTMIALFSDDTAVMATSKDYTVAFNQLQQSLTCLQALLKKWRVKVNESKSTHVTYRLRHKT